MERKSKAGLTLLFAAMLLIPLASIFPVNAQIYGPKLDQIRFRVIKSPDAQTLAMVRREIDVLVDLIRPVDVETLSRAGRNILSMPGDHYCYLCFNMRDERTSDPVKILPFGPQDGSQPGLALRHAIAHLVPKAVLIGTLFKYIVTQIDVPMSAALGTFGADIDTHPYNPTMATNILTTGGWTYSGGVWHVPATVPPEYPLPGGSALPTIEFFSPTLEAAPTSWTIVETTCQNMRDIGISVDHTEYDLTTMIDMIDAGNFEIYFLCWTNLGRFGDFLYDFFHSDLDVPAGTNRPGLRNDDYDDLSWDMYTTLDKSYQEQKVKECLEMLMGTSAYQNSLTTDGIVPYVPIYSRTYYDGWDEYLAGQVNIKLAGSWNGWSRDNSYWLAGHERASDLVPGGTMMIFCHGEDYQAGNAGGANPLWVSSATTWDHIEAIYDGLIGLNGFNLKDKEGWLDLDRDPDPNTTPGFRILPWTVTDGPAAGEDGMKVTFYLNDTTTRLWHDEHAYDAYDIAFQWEYMTVNKIPRGWGTFGYFHHCVIEDPYTITAYMTTTGITLPYGLSGWSDTCPEHIWGCTPSNVRGGRATAQCVQGSTLHGRTVTWNQMVSQINSGAVQGTAGNKLTGDPDATAESGLCLCDIGTQGAGGKLTCIHGSGCVLDDWATAENEILDYDPAYYARPTSRYPWLTEQLGTGAWVFHDINLAAGTGNLVAFRAYPVDQVEAHNLLTQYFWELGDVDKNGMIRVVYDLAIQGANFFKPVPPAPINADINKDGIVDIRDMSYGGLNYGEDREVFP